jgi:hypothetical protein
LRYSAPNKQSAKKKTNSVPAIAAAAYLKNTLCSKISTRKNSNNM